MRPASRTPKLTAGLTSAVETGFDAVRHRDDGQSECKGYSENVDRGRATPYSRDYGRAAAKKTNVKVPINSAIGFSSYLSPQPPNAISTAQHVNFTRGACGRHAQLTGRADCTPPALRTHRRPQRGSRGVGGPCIEASRPSRPHCSSPERNICRSRIRGVREEQSRICRQSSLHFSGASAAKARGMFLRKAGSHGRNPRLRRRRCPRKQRHQPRGRRRAGGDLQYRQACIATSGALHRMASRTSPTARSTATRSNAASTSARSTCRAASRRSRPASSRSRPTRPKSATARCLSISETPGADRGVVSWLRGAQARCERLFAAARHPASRRQAG